MKRAVLAVVALMSLGLSVFPACGGTEDTGADAAQATTDAAQASTDAATNVPADAATSIPADAATSIPPDAGTIPPDAGTIPADASTTTTTVSYASDIQPIFSQRCTSCHGSSGNLNLSSGQSYANLVNKPAAGPSCGNSGLKRVVPGDTANSLLWQKTGATQTCGSAMPLGSSGLKNVDNAQFKKIETWITEGALNN